MQQRLLSIFERSGDDHLGQTLTRLASLAAAAHRYEAAAQIDLDTTSDRTRMPDHRVVHQPRTDAGLIRTEADR